MASLNRLCRFEFGAPRDAVSLTQVIHAMFSHPGRVRSHNEDACAVCPELGTFVVCDGMGGAAAGEVASRMAAQSLIDHLAQPVESSVRPQTRLHSAVLAANTAVHQYAREHPELAGMGTTMVALLHVAAPIKDRRAVPRSPRPQRFTTPPSLFLANVGDSRCYRWRGGHLSQLSMDHSFVDAQLRAGQITPEEAAASPMRNFITRAIGPADHIEPDIDSVRTEPGDVYLLASDGLTRELDNEAIATVLERELGTEAPSQPRLNEAGHALVAAANEQGGRDNITVLLLAMVGGESRHNGAGAGARETTGA